MIYYRNDDNLEGDEDDDVNDDGEEDDDDDYDSFHQFLETLSQSLDLVSIKLCAVHWEACLMKIS